RQPPNAPGPRPPRNRHRRCRPPPHAPRPGAGSLPGRKAGLCRRIADHLYSSHPLPEAAHYRDSTLPTQARHEVSRRPVATGRITENAPHHAPDDLIGNDFCFKMASLHASRRTGAAMTATLTPTLELAFDLIRRPSVT